MKALSLTQPWATLVAERHKRYETRSWGRPANLAPLAIHAAKGLPGFVHDIWATEIRFAQVLYPQQLEQLPRGCIVAVALHGFTSWEIPPPAPGMAGIHGSDEEIFGDWRPGRYAWKFQRVIALPEPIPCKGALGLWEVPPDTLSQVMVQLEAVRA